MLQIVGLEHDPMRAGIDRAVDEDEQAASVDVIPAPPHRNSAGP